MGDLISIRPIGVLDAELVLDWENNVEGWNMSENERPYHILDILNLIHELEDIHTAKQARWMIVYEQMPIGVVDLTDIDFDDKTAFVGILIADESLRRKGFATIALKLIEREAEQLNIERLYCTILPSNHKSIHLFEKIGFTKIGNSDDKYLDDGVYLHGLIFEKCLKKSSS